MYVWPTSRLFYLSICPLQVVRVNPGHFMVPTFVGWDVHGRGGGA